MKVDIELYRTFYQVAVSGSVSAAARRLFLTQSAVSQAIRRLEESVGVRLFDRLPRGMGLTAEGRRLLPRVEGALNLIAAAERELTDMAALESGELYIAAGDTLCRHYLLPYLERFHAAHPAVTLRITNRTSEQTAELLRRSTVHIGVVNMPCDEAGIEVEPVRAITDCFVAGDKAFVSTTVSYRRLAELPLLLLEEGTNTRRFLDAHFAAHGIRLRPEFELGSVDLLIEFARIGLGISAVVREFVARELETANLFELRLDPPLPSRSIGVAWRSGAPLSPAAEELLRMMRSEHR